MSNKEDTAKMFKKLEAIRDKLASKDNMKDTGDFAVDLIKKRTRLGFGVNEHGDKKKKLDKLSPKYVKQRKKNKPKGPTTPSKSNLTDTGDMLDDLVAKPSKGTSSIEFKSSKSENKAELVSKDRPFNKLSKSEQKQIFNFLDKKAKKLSKK